MFQPDPARFVGDRQQEFISVIMLRAEQLYGLLHQLAVRLDLLGFRFELSRFVGEDVQIGPVGQLPLAIMTSRANRRINERFIVRLRSEEHTSELPSLMRISYSDFCLKTHKRIHFKATFYQQ